MFIVKLKLNEADAYKLWGEFILWTEASKMMKVFSRNLKEKILIREEAREIWSFSKTSLV